MIRKEMLKESLESFKKFYDWSDRAFEVGLDILNIDEVNNILNTYQNLIEYCCKDEYTEDRENTYIGNYMYDNDFGRSMNIFEDIRESEEIRSFEELWNKIITEHPEVKDE